MSNFLTLAVEQSLGDVRVRATCSLSAPWTLLFGPSGAGKTSLLRMIAGLSRPDRGTITLHGRTLVNTEQRICLAPRERTIGLLAQRPALFPHLNVADNVAFALAHLDRPRREECTTRMLALLQVDHLARRMPARLSGGEQQRVALARALAPEPRFLLLDEPFTGMDPDLKQSLLTRLTTWLAERNIPALYVSHDVTEALQGSAEVLLMQDGAIQAQGPAAVVLAARRDQLLQALDARRRLNEPSHADGSSHSNG